MGCFWHNARGMHLNWPKSSNTSLTELGTNLQSLLDGLCWKSAEAVIAGVNSALAAAIRDHQSTSLQQYKLFLENSLGGSAAAAHSLLKVYERDGTLSYEDEEQERLWQQGVSLQERMTTRINV